MKIAIFHNYLDNIGGAEIVCLTLAKYLRADFYTTNIDSEKIEKMGFANILPRIFSIGKIPLNAPLKQQLALRKFRKLNLGKKYDFYIIGGDWAVSGAINNKPNLWYVHSPIREIWDLYEYTRKNSVPPFLRSVFDFWVLYNRYLNKKYVNEVNKIICNSYNTKKRLKKYLNKDATVINPPIETSKFYYNKPKNYWLSVNRLISHKRVELQLKAFANFPNEKLIIVGSYEQSRHFKQYANYCQKIKPENVEIKSWVSHQELIELYANCKGFITTSKEEDFGMNVVEAMAAGKSVIAPDEGGYKETLVNEKTGILIDDITSDKLIEAIKKLDKKISQKPFEFKKACEEQAKKFDVNIFVEKIKEELEKTRNRMNVSAKFLIRGGTNDEGPIEEIWKHKTYFKKGFEIKNDFVVVDLGANIGGFTVYAAKKANKGVVYSYEPEPENFELLKKNININNLKNVKAFELAVSDRNGGAKLYLDKNSNGSHSIFKISPRFVEIETTTIENIFKDNKICHCNFLKMDVEGSEDVILQVIPKDCFEKIDLIVLEYHSFIKKDILPKLLKILNKNNFEIVIKPLNRIQGIIYAKRSPKNNPLYVKNLKNFYLYQLKLFYVKIWALFYLLDRSLGRFGIYLKKKAPKIYYFLNRIRFLIFGNEKT